MAEKFCQKYGNGVHNLKIGKSFEKKGGGNSVYHSIRYDFKPVSVDEERKGVLEVGENKSVTVNLPHLDGVSQTNYKGNAKPANTKDCILIIDHETGELTLERITNQIMVKKTRSAAPGAYGGAGAGGGGAGMCDDLTLPSGPPLPLPSNPYEVKERPEKPAPSKKPPMEAESNPYAVNPNPYLPKKVPDKPKVSGGGGRPLTPLQQARSSGNMHRKKGSPGAGGGVGGLQEMSPIHSAKSSPVPTRPAGGARVDSLGRPLESSDSSGSDSSGSESEDSDSESEGKGVGSSLPPSMPGMLEDLLESNSGPPAPPSHPPRGGALPTARPQPPAQPPRPPKPSKPPPPTNSMPTNLFGDLEDDLDLSDSD